MIPEVSSLAPDGGESDHDDDLRGENEAEVVGPGQKVALLSVDLLALVTHQAGAVLALSPVLRPTGDTLEVEVAGTDHHRVLAQEDLQRRPGSSRHQAPPSGLEQEVRDQSGVRSYLYTGTDLPEIRSVDLHPPAGDTGISRRRLSLLQLEVS